MIINIIIWYFLSVSCIVLKYVWLISITNHFSFVINQINLFSLFKSIKIWIFDLKKKSNSISDHDIDISKGSATPYLQLAL